MLQEVNNFPGIMFFSIYTKRKKKKHICKTSIYSLGDLLFQFQEDT